MGVAVCEKLVGCVVCFVYIIRCVFLTPIFGDPGIDFGTFGGGFYPLTTLFIANLSENPEKKIHIYHSISP